jgi:hypothetical protein
VVPYHDANIVLLLSIYTSCRSQSVAAGDHGGTAHQISFFNINQTRHHRVLVHTGLFSTLNSMLPKQKKIYFNSFFAQNTNTVYRQTQQYNNIQQCATCCGPSEPTTDTFITRVYKNINTFCNKQILRL